MERNFFFATAAPVFSARKTGVQDGPKTTTTALAKCDKISFCKLVQPEPYVDETFTAH